jgi:predicted MPP superfamily phosphohydrolase
MILALLHLSDAHFRADRTLDVISLAKNVAAALQSADPLVDHCMFIVSGDIAYSGQTQEYRIAEQFFSQLASEIESKRDRLPVVVVPGNHDCNFSQDTDIRRIVLESVPSNPERLNSSGVQEQLLTVQREFFEFNSRLAGAPGSENPWFASGEDVSVGGHLVRVIRLNTSAMSKLDEKQGQLYFPSKAAQDCFAHADAASLVITVFHHPYNWLEDVNSLLLKKAIETETDVVLTGHRHVESAYTTELTSGQRLEYVEGAILHSSTSQESGFNVVLCDLERKLHKVYQFRWNGERYAPQVEGQWKTFLRNDLFSRRFENNPEFLKTLKEVGMGFTHPRRQNLQLEDIFVYPDLQRISFGRSEENKLSPSLIPSAETAEFIGKQKLLLMVGSDQSGRTALAKKTYSDVQKQGYVPILINGGELKAKNREGFLRALDEAFSQQYSTNSLEAFRQLPAERKALIIDDWHAIRFTEKNRRQVIEASKRVFGIVLVFTRDIFRIEEIAARRDETHPFLGFEYCEIKHFSNVLRGRLIEKWLSLDRDGPSDDPALARDIASADKTIRTLLGKQLLPSLPFIVITLISAYESSKDTTSPSGSYGYLYELIITKAIAKVSKDLTEVDLKYVVLSKLAYYLFEKNKKRFTLPDMRQVVDDYRTEYDIGLNAEDLLRDFQLANLVTISDGNFEFRYKYAYYYFVARYFRDAMRLDEHRPKFETKLQEMVDSVYYDEYMNILMFVLYLTKDAKLIQHIVGRAKQIFGNSDPCDFDGHIRFINKLYTEPPKLILTSTSYEQARERERQDIDEDEAIDASEDSDAAVKSVVYNENLQDLVKLNFAFKTLQLMGQILRNFPGSLDRDTKLELTRECYLLGLRSLRAILASAEQNLEDFRSYVAEIIKAHRPIMSESEVARTADEAILWLARRCAFGMMKRISYAVGLEILVETYKRVLQSTGESRPFRLIDLTVKLDHFTVFPRNDLEDVWSETENDQFCQMIVTDLIVNHLYLIPVDDRTKQSVCTLLKIKFQRVLPQG